MIAVYREMDIKHLHYYVKNGFGLWCHDGLGWFPYSVTLGPTCLEKASWLELLLNTGISKGQASDINSAFISECYEAVVCV